MKAGLGIFFFYIVNLSSVFAINIEKKTVYNPVKTVKIIRDSYGVPHVYAASLESLFYGIGYAQAKDRLWQADLNRRLAKGQLAEIFGQDFVVGDVFARTLFGSVIRREKLLKAARVETRIKLAAFTKGINAWISHATKTAQLPAEYSAYGLSVRPWTMDDSVAIAMMFGAQFGLAGNEEVLNFEHLQTLRSLHNSDDIAALIFNDTHWLDDESAPTSVPSNHLTKHLAKNPTSKYPKIKINPSIVSAFKVQQRGWRKNSNFIGFSKRPASNAVVIAPKLSVNGRALLLGGPQMGYSTPQISHEMGIHGAGFNTVGMQLAGWPGVIIGINQTQAWTLTSGMSDNSDIYLEVVNKQRYNYKNQWLEFDCRVEEVSVRGAGVHSEKVCESVHGPVLARFDSHALSYKVASRGHELSSFEYLSDVSKASSLSEVNSALSKIAYNFNVLYADTSGNIAYWHIGRIPIRSAYDNPWLPHNGTGDSEWQGFVAWKNMPRALNPIQGWLVSWNNKPKAGWKNSVAGFGSQGPVHRVSTLIRLLKQLKANSADLTYLERINKVSGLTLDTPSGNSFTVVAPTLKKLLIKQLNVNSDSRIGPVVALLNKWNGLQTDADQDGYYDQAAVAIFNTWWSELLKQVFADDLADTVDNNVKANLIARMLMKNSSVGLQYDYLNGVPMSTMVTHSFIKALDSLTVRYNSTNSEDWLQAIAVIKWRPLGLVGVEDSIWMNRGTYNQIVRLDKHRPYGKNVLAPGQSGDANSPHFADQFKLYTSWKYKKMNLSPSDLKAGLSTVILLKVP